MESYALRRVAALGVAVLLAGCNHSPPTDARLAPPLVETWVVKPAGSATRSFTGVVVARVQSDLAFRVAGKIVERFVDVGQHVHRGDPLMRLDPADLALAVTVEQGSVDAARARSVKADADLARLQGLVQQGAISAQDYDLAVATARSAKAQLDAALAQVNLARNADEYGILHADADGIIVSRLVDAGQVVSPGQPVLVLAQDGPREALVTLPETVQPALGSTALASLYGSDRVVGKATLRELSHAADPLTRTYAARYVLTDLAANTPLGATVAIKLAEADSSTEMSVPLSAIFDQGHGPGVWVVGKDDRLSYQPVRVKSTGAETATISAGLSTGERIVALGAHQLTEHQDVRVASEVWHEGSATTADVDTEEVHP